VEEKREDSSGELSHRVERREIKEREERGGRRLRRMTRGKTIHKSS
jgi:hypothetical protein